MVLYLIFTLETLLLKTAQNASLVGGRDDAMRCSTPSQSEAIIKPWLTNGGLALQGIDAAGSLPFTLFAENMCAQVQQYNIQSLFWIN